MRESRIVMVEDYTADVLFVKEALKFQGIHFSLQHYINGDDALEGLYAMHEAPDLILLDIKLPRVNGFDILRMLRNHPVLFNVPVAIVTSSLSAGDKSTAQQLGANSYIVKPSTYDDYMMEVGGEFARLLRTPAARLGPQPVPYHSADSR